ncbi:MAG TPA: CAP domain-containing protein [Caulobacteraceae bacterium]|nr:CAP domain-containing protein [Caulobacteraceae bacterium]
MRDLSNREGGVVRWFACGLAAVVVGLAPAALARPQRDGGGLEPALLAQINWVRAHPGAYADRLRDASETRATDEAIDFLERREPAPPLQFNAGLEASAARHAADEGEHGAFTHTGSDGSSAGERMHRAGVWAGMMAEEMSAGESSADDIVRQLIIDEDVPGRGHRNDLMDPFLKQAGVGCASHPVYSVICVIDLASAPPPRD